MRKSYGGAYAVMGSKQLTADLNFAWPTARIAVIGAEGAAQLLVKRFPDPTAPEVQKIRADFIEGYNLNLATPWIAAERGYIDGVIEPHETRLLLRKSHAAVAGQADHARAAQARPDSHLADSRPGSWVGDADRRRRGELQVRYLPLVSEFRDAQHVERLRITNPSQVPCRRDEKLAMCSREPTTPLQANPTDPWCRRGSAPRALPACAWRLRRSWALRRRCRRRDTSTDRFDQDRRQEPPAARDLRRVCSQTFAHGLLGDTDTARNRRARHAAVTREGNPRSRGR